MRVAEREKEGNWSETGRELKEREHGDNIRGPPTIYILWETLMLRETFSAPSPRPLTLSVPFFRLHASAANSWPVLFQNPYLSLQVRMTMFLSAVRKGLSRSCEFRWSCFFPFFLGIFVYPTVFLVLKHLISPIGIQLPMIVVFGTFLSAQVNNVKMDIVKLKTRMAELELRTSHQIKEMERNELDQMHGILASAPLLRPCCGTFNHCSE